MVLVADSLWLWFAQKQKKPHPAWVFLRKMPEKQLILFAWPYILDIVVSNNKCTDNSYVVAIFSKV